MVATAEAALIAGIDPQSCIHAISLLGLAVNEEWRRAQ
jgi:hypothetical protein